MRYLLTIDLPESYAKRVKKLQEKHRPDAWKIMIDPHVTLTISRETELKPAEAKRILKAASLKSEPFELRLKGIRQFRNSRVRVIYVGAELTKPLKRLYRNAMRELGGLLLPEDKKRFTPHVTVSNRLTPKEARRIIGELKAENLNYNFVVRCVSLYKKGPKDKRWAHLADKWLG